MGNPKLVQNSKPNVSKKSKNDLDEYMKKLVLEKSQQDKYKANEDYLNNPFNRERLNKNLNDLLKIISVVDPIGILDNTGIKAEAGNVFYNKVVSPQNYASEFIGGITDANQAIQNFKGGRILPKFNNNQLDPGGLLNSIWALSGFIEIPDAAKRYLPLRVASYIDDVVESTKLSGDMYDIVSPFLTKEDTDIPKKSYGGAISTTNNSTLLDAIYSYLNYKNWGVTDYSDKGDFDAAYAAARKAGEKEFMWNNKRFNTRKDTDDLNITMPNKNLNPDWTPEKYNDYLKTNYPEFFKVINRGKGINEIEFGHTSVHNETPNRGSYNLHNNKIYTGSQKTKTDDWRYAERNDILGTILSEMAHVKDDKLSDNPLKSYAWNTRMEHWKYNENKYNVPGTIEYNTHRLYEPGLAMIAYGDLSPNDIKRIQKYVGVEEDGYFGEQTYKAIQDKYKDSPYIQSALKEHQFYTQDKDKNPISMGVYSKLPKAYLHQINQDVPLRDSKRFYDVLQYSDYTDNALLNIKPGSGDYDVKELQRALTTRGYKLPKSTKKDGSFDGIWGDETENALLDYQTKNNMNNLPKKSYGGAILSNAGNFASQGASIGSLFPGAGTAIGAIGGGVLGGVLGLLQEKAKRNELAKQKQLEDEAIKKEQLFLNKNADRQIMSNFPTYGVNQSYFRKGGKIQNPINLPEFEVKGKKIKVVDDPNDPAYRAYQDSLNAYNRTEELIVFARDNPYFDNPEFDSIARRYGENTARLFRHDINLAIDMVRLGAEDNPYKTMYPVYKKPTNPIYLKDSKEAQQAERNWLKENPITPIQSIKYGNSKPQLTPPELKESKVNFKSGNKPYILANTYGYYDSRRRDNDIYGYEVDEKGNKTELRYSVMDKMSPEERKNYFESFGSGYLNERYYPVEKRERWKPKIKFGGTPTPQYEAEGDEVVQFNPANKPKMYDTGYLQQHSSTTATIKGKSHEQGGEDMSGGDRIFSDKVYFNSKKDADIINALRKTLKNL